MAWLLAFPRLDGSLRGLPVFFLPNAQPFPRQSESAICNPRAVTQQREFNR